MRSGVLAKKLGMTRYFTNDGVSIPVTLLHIDGSHVVSVKREEVNGYNALQLGSGVRKVKNVSKSVRGHYAKAKIEPKAKLVEFRVTSECLLEVGQVIGANHYVVGQYVDVVGQSKGKGFAGAMKRHNFSGLEASHGISVSHRSHGSTGQCQDPGKVFKGKKMAGHLGDERVSIQNLEIIDIDVESGIVAVAGAVPGSKNGYVQISDAIKRARPAEAPFPAGLIGSEANNNDADANESSEKTEAAEADAEASESAVDKE